MPTRVVPDQKQDLLADPFELLGTPSEKLRRYRAYGPTIHESQPRLIELWQVEPVTRDGFRIGVVLGDRLLDEAHRLALSSQKLLKVGKASRLHQHSSQKLTAQVSGLSWATSINRSRLLFFFRRGDRVK